MTPDVKTQLIETAVRPLDGDAEIRLAATHLLETLVKSDGGGAEEAIARWDAVDGKKRRAPWRMLLWVLLVTVSVGIGIKAVPEVVRYWQWARWVGALSTFSVEAMPVVEPNREYTARQRLLLFGESLTSTPLKKAEALWRSEPENPAFFAEYAAVYGLEYNKIPTGFRETAKRLDPENAWFTYLAAAVEAKEAVKAKSRKSKMVGGKKVYEEPKAWQILDQGRVDRTLELVREAAAQEKWNDYVSVMLKERISLLPQRSPLEKINLFSTIGRMTFPTIRLRVISDVIAAKAWSCGETGDVKGFQEISGQGDHFLRGISSPEGILVDQLVANVCAATLSDSFAGAAGKLGLTEESAHWRNISDQLQERGQSRSSRQFIVDGKVVKTGTVTGTLTGGSIEMIAMQAEHQPPLTDMDLKPTRLQDHEILSRLCCYVLWIMVALCMGSVAAYRFRVPAMARQLARRMELLLGVVDWCWAVGGGVLLPFALVMAVNRLTPLGGRQFGILGTSMLLPAAHFLGLLMLWLIVPPQIVRWRLEQRAGVFGFPRTSWLGWLAVGVAAAFVPMIGWAAVSDSFTAFAGIWMKTAEKGAIFPLSSVLLFGCALGLLAVSALWVFFGISAAILTSSYRLLQRATAALVLVRVYACAMLVLALATFGFKAAEQYWFEQDTLMKADASVSGWSVFEFKVSAQMRKELRETLGYAP